tara:strand:- start:142 stop:555 length:414 start_codon:yes stop_codon:yes gene_type:complete
MKKDEFKQMIKESVKEVLVEEGVLKSVISEVVKAVATTQSENPLPENKSAFTQQVNEEATKRRTQQLAETRKKMLDAIGNDSYGGVDLFEGTTPIKNAGNPNSSGAPSSALEGVDPNDSGVDISNLFSGVDVWKKLI